VLSDAAPLERGANAVSAAGFGDIFRTRVHHSSTLMFSPIHLPVFRDTKSHLMGHCIREVGEAPQASLGSVRVRHMGVHGSQHEGQGVLA
jgi:hypothetical protein